MSTAKGGGRAYGLLLLQSGGNIVDEIIVIRAADPDGSIFKAIVNALKDKRTEAVHVADTVSSVLRVGELEIHHEYRRVLMAGREVWRVCHALLHGQLTRASLLKSAALCGGLGGGISAWDELRGEYHLAAEKKAGARSKEPNLH